MTHQPEPEAEMEVQADRMRLFRLEDSRLAWDRTGNPLYVWEALDSCHADQPLPAWIVAYLRNCRRELRGLSFPHQRHPAAKLTPAEATERIPEAFGFRRRPNWNAIEARRLDNVAGGVLLEVCATGGRDRKVVGQIAKRLSLSKEYVRMLRDRAINLWHR